MITLRRLDQREIVVNATHIVVVEATPDTLITLSTGEKLLVRDTPSEVIERATQYLRMLGRGPLAPVVKPNFNAAAED